RNAKTNRCRKVETGSSITTPARIDPAKTAQQNILTMSTPLGWGIASFAVVGVLGYGLFEWRSEAMVAIGRMRNFFNSTK
ncbi:hypothetical protein CYG49_04950, partial [Candidatus Saccharibacteria bacterium]